MSERITIKSASQHELMRRAGALTGETLAYLGTLVKPGITTKQLDEAAEAYIRSHGGIPSFFFFLFFPASLRASDSE